MNSNFITPFEIHEIVRNLSDNDFLDFHSITAQNYKSKLDEIAHNDDLIRELRVYAAFAVPMSCNNIRVNNFITSIMNFCGEKRDSSSLILLDDILYDKSYMIPGNMGTSHLLYKEGTASRANNENCGYLKVFQSHFYAKYFNPEKAIRYNVKQELANCHKAIGFNIDYAITSGDRTIEDIMYLHAAHRFIEKTWCNSDTIGSLIFFYLLNSRVMKDDEEYIMAEKVVNHLVSQNFLPCKLITWITLFANQGTFESMLNKLPNNLFGAEHYYKSFNIENEFSYENRFVENIKHRFHKLIEVLNPNENKKSQEFIHLSKIQQQAIFSSCESIFDACTENNPVVDAIIERLAKKEFIEILMKHLSLAKDPATIRSSIDRYPFIKPHLGLLPREIRASLVSHDFDF